MPTRRQTGSSTEYKSESHRIIQEKTKPILLPLKPMEEEHARSLLGAANELDAPLEVKKHFANQVKICKERDDA